jgi:hypothetical protein
LDVALPGFPGFPESAAARAKETGRHDNGSTQPWRSTPPKYGLPFIPADFDDLDLDCGEFRIYCHLCRRSNGGKGDAFPSILSISQSCRMRKTHVIEAIHQLEGRGMIEVIRKPGTKTIYRLVLPTRTDYQGTQRHSVEDTGYQNRSPNYQGPFSQIPVSVLP